MNLTDENFREWAEEIISFVIKYDDSLPHQPVMTSNAPGKIFESFEGELSYSGQKNIKRLLQEVSEKIIPGMCHWSHPDNIAWFPNIQPRVTILASILENALNCIGFSWSSCPALTELEQVVLDWIADLIGLPNCFKFSNHGPGGGCFQGTASEATFNACLAARNRSLNLNNDLDPRHLVAYCSDQAHSSASRAAQMSLMKIRKIIPDTDGRMTGKNLRTQILEDISKNLIPCFVVCTLGTTGMCYFDDISSVTKVAGEFSTEKNKIWVHVDAAYGGSMLAVPEFRESLLEGVEKVDSFNMNLSKCGVGGFDSSPMWIKNRTDLTNSFIENPDYLQSHENQFTENFHQINFRDWTPAFGRKFRALRVWLVMKTYGKDGIQTIVKKHVQLATRFADLVTNSENFELACPIGYGLVCFRMKENTEMSVECLASRLKDKHGILITTASWQGSPYLRASFNPLTCSTENLEKIFLKISEILKHK